MIQKTNQKSFQFYKKNFYQIIYIYAKYESGCKNCLI